MKYLHDLWFAPSLAAGTQSSAPRLISQVWVSAAAVAALAILAAVIFSRWRWAVLTTTSTVLAIGVIVAWARTSRNEEGLQLISRNERNGSLHTINWRVCWHAGGIRMERREDWISLSSRALRNYQVGRRLYWSSWPSRFYPQGRADGSWGFWRIGDRFRFQFTHLREPPNPTGIRMFEDGATVPCWFAVLLFLIFPLTKSARYVVRRRSAVPGCCQCGYDLRASADRCPECGRSFRPSPLEHPGPASAKDEADAREPS